jgi:dienelactone hydrolase
MQQERQLLRDGRILAIDPLLFGIASQFMCVDLIPNLGINKLEQRSHLLALLSSIELMSSAIEESSIENDTHNRPNLVEIHACVRATLANLDVEGVEFFIELDGGTLNLTLQTQKFLEAQELAVDLGKKIEQIAAADILELAVYKRKKAEVKAFPIKKMALGKPGIPEAEDCIPEIPVPIANSRQQSYIEQERLDSQYRPRQALSGTQIYLLRSFSALIALGVGIGAVYGISQIFGSFEQKPLTYIDVNQLPGLGTILNDPEVMRYQVAFPRGIFISKFIVFLPTNPTKAKIPCVFIAASGTESTAPFSGRSLEEMDVMNPVNFAKAGYAVVAYDVDGDIGSIDIIDRVESFEERKKKILINLIKAYKASDAGVLNAKLAIDYTVARIPQIDPNAMYVAGTGSGGTISLMVAATDKRIKAAIANSPYTNLPGKYSSLMETVSKSVPGYKEFIDRSSPHNNIEKMTKPIFIFHDDRLSDISLEDTTNFVSSVKQKNPAISLTHDRDKNFVVGSSMSSSSIQQSIEWLNSQK